MTMLVTLVVCFALASAQEYSYDAGSPVQNLIYDASSKRIFVGATNQILRLSDDLKSVVAKKETGPVMDSDECYYGIGCGEEVMTNNVNKILLINKGQLIFCGSVKGGRCTASDMSTLRVSNYTSSSNSSQWFWVASAKSATYAITSSGLNNNEGMFVAVERGYRGNSLGASFPFIASYYINVMDTDRMFQRVPNGWMKMTSKAQFFYIFTSSPYFYTVGKRLSDTSPFISRICLMDTGNYDKWENTRYKSYIDIKFKCEGDTGSTRVQYRELKNIIMDKISVNLALQFGGNKGDELILALFYDAATKTHAICPYLVKSLNSEYDAVTGQSGRCNHRNRNIDKEILLSPISTFANENVTSLALFNVKDDNVLVAGTNDGKVLKIVLRGQAEQGLQTSVGPLTSGPLIRITSSSTVLYGLSGSRVIGEPLGRCGGFTTCETCVQSTDPFCGWCLLKARCMQYSECDPGVANSGFLPEQWVNSKVTDSQCFPITSLTPSYARITNATKVEATSRELVNALRGRSIACDWMNGTKRLGSESAILSDGVIACSTPVLDVGILSPEQDSIRLTVKLREEGQLNTFLTLYEQFPLYYCTNNKLCYTCTTSEFDCKWCKDTNLCLQTSEGCGATVSVFTQWFQCPMLLAKNYTMEAQDDGRLSLSAANIPMSTEGDYKCSIWTSDMRLIETRAQPSQTSSKEQTLQCTIPLGKLEITKDPQFLPVNVTYKNVSIYNQNNSAQLILYSCKKTLDCSSCKGFDQTYGCTWCTSLNQCTRSIDCEMVYQVRENRCANPQILEVSPARGPLEGGTLLTLGGKDLSITLKDVMNITVAGYACKIQPTNYLVSSRVTCLTRAVKRPTDGVIRFRSVNGDVVTADPSFAYLEASITRISPLIVLRTGGTNVTISGSQLDMGSNQSVTLAGTPCDIMSRGSSIVCRTRAVAEEMEGKVLLAIDSARYTSTDIFTYINVPDVNQVSPTDSIVDGGITITLYAVRGFTSITSAQIYFTDDSTVDNRVSTVANCMAATTDQKLVCVTPTLIDSRSIPDMGRRVNISLTLENSYTKTLEYTAFNIYPNPIVMDTDTVLSAGQSLVIKGKYFDRVKGIEVYLDDTLCENLDVSDKIITCDVPDLLAQNEVDNQSRRKKRQSDTADDGGDDEKKSTIEKAVFIKVKLGNYESEPISATFVQELPVKGNIVGILGACIAGGVIVIFLMFAVCLLHRRRLQQKKQFKHIMLQEMERIEIRLAEECKQVFTELQTDLADLNSDFSPATIPYHSFGDYALKVLFPAQDDHPVLHEPADLPAYEDSLGVFEKLIHQEAFLLTLVETLDKQRQVSKRDKSNIAALMIVSLMDDMAYTTVILRSLLSKLISDTVNSDARRIKLLLRRSEHITEKYLSNWLTFNLHSFLCESAGQPLYVLYRAIKQQIEKGPVDYITGNARYALHEKNLLSKITEFHKLNVMVYLDDDPYLKDTPYTPLKSCQVSLLSCDTISQTKAKIIDAMYRTVPDSLKPTPNDVDVEWKSGTTSSLRLVDMLHNTQDGWKQLDTLGTLNIDDQAVFQCIPRQSPPPFMSQSGGAPSCNSLLREIENGRVWHLERDVDNEADGKGGMSGVKTVPEVFLTRLSATKIPLQKFVDDLFNVIFTPNEGITSLPPCVKYLMDFLDSEANRLQINDPEVLHTWKNNALPLRYWISIIKSPDVVFDVRKNNNIDSCLSVIAQTFIDATYYEDMTIDKASQSSRLLYCKEIPTYKQHVREFYGEIQTCRPVTENDVDVSFNKDKKQTQLRKQSALYEMFHYACRFSEELRESLQDKGYRDLADQFLSIADIGSEHANSYDKQSV